MRRPKGSTSSTGLSGRGPTRTRGYSGLAPKTISSQDGTERRERRRDFFLAGDVLGMSGRGSCVSAAEAADGPGDALARTSEREGMGISGTGSVGLSAPSGA